MVIKSEETILDVVDKDNGVLIITETQEVRLSWPAAFILHELGYEPMRRKDLYQVLNFSEGQIDYALEILVKNRLVRKTKDKKYTLTTAGVNVWHKL